MKNLESAGRNIDLTAPYEVASGEYVLVGQLGGVACGDAANGAAVTVSTEGVFVLPKASGDVFASAGLPVYYNVTDQLASSHTDSDSNSAGETSALIGVTVAAAGAGTTTVRVKLAPAPLTLV